MTFTRGDIIRHRATGQRGVVIRVDSIEDNNTYVIDYGFGERGATCVQECVIEAVGTKCPPITIRPKP